MWSPRCPSIFKNWSSVWLPSTGSSSIKPVNHNFKTHCGLFRYKRLIFGVNAAAEIFQHAIQRVISDIKNAQNVSDEIITFGRSQEEHAQALMKTLQKLHESGLTVNAKKCEFNKEKISFFSHVFSKGGISLDPKKVKALQEARKPENASEVRLFLGMAQNSARLSQVSQQ